MLVMHTINEDMNNKLLDNFIQGPSSYLFQSFEEATSDKLTTDCNIPASCSLLLEPEIRNK